MWRREGAAAIRCTIMDARGDEVRVLVVDDDPDWRDMLRMQLELLHQLEVVGEAGDGAEALQQVRTTSPDAIVLDLMMPGMDGLEAITHLRADHPDVPVVAYSAVTSATAQDHCTAHGVPLLRKSGDTTSLVDQLHALAG